jgi:hypothetical protein
MAFPEIPPGLPFPKGGELIYRISINPGPFIPLKRGFDSFANVQIVTIIKAQKNSLQSLPL